MKHFESSFWPIAWAVLLQVGWLLPNHYPPWSTFHLDSWIASVAIAASAAIVVLPPRRTPWHGMALLTALLMLFPGIQYGLGLVTSAGNAWVSTAYIVGFLLALLTGARWETLREGHLLDCLFLAICIGAALSVGLQLHQWLALDRLGIWSMGDGFGRPFANFGQPNQLATFLIWAILGLAWGFVRRRIGGITVIGVAIYLLFGLALTASRTGWLAVAMLVVAAWYWRRLWPDARAPWVALGLAAYFAVCTLSIGWLSQALMGAIPEDLGGLTRISGESRPAVWALFLDAITQRPWLGYGWNQVALGQLAVAVEHPPLHVFFSHSHNLFLDLILWCGIPLGAAISAWLLRWLWRRVAGVRSAENATLVLFLLVVANHAMLEFPLHYAYFLIPVGLVIGALDVRMGIQPVMMSGRSLIVVVWIVAATLLALIIRDYARVETAYRTLRFEWANIGTRLAEPPDVLLLTQWKDFIRMAKFEPYAGMREVDLQWMRDMVGLYPSAGFFQRVAVALALNRQPEEAVLWLHRACHVVSQAQCAALKVAWENQALTRVEIKAVPWPH